MALGLEVTRALALFPRGAFLQWDLVDPQEQGDYLFDVYRGGSPGGPWDLLHGAAEGIYNYTDRLPTEAPSPPIPAHALVQTNQLQLTRAIYYRVVVTSPSGVKAEAITTLEPKLAGRFKLLKRKMVRDESVLLKLNGVEVAVLKRKHWGPRCTKCFDRYSKEVVRSNCTLCYGTGFIGGYYAPIATLARRLPVPAHKDVTQHGEAEVKLTRITMLDAPKISLNDVIVFLRDNRRFLVKEITSTELKTVTIHQSAVVSELARSAVEYRVPVDADRTPSLF